MAKQSGLHQIRGKVGEHSYYRQTGISSGLIRSINQGMSERVKTSEEYANTRLNNQEFGAAANVASLLGKCVTPKFRPMILPFSQSKMAKEILRLARQNLNNWGQRTVVSNQVAQICDILTSLSKRTFSDMLSFSVSRESATSASVACSYTGDQSTLMKSLGIDAVTVTATQFDLATGQWNPNVGEMATGYLYRKDSVDALDEQELVAGSGATNSEDMTVATFVPEANHSGMQIVVLVFIPFRSLNGGLNVLQEYCSFVAMPLPAYVP